MQSREEVNPNKVMKSVDRALAVLRYFTVAEPELGLADVTRRSGLDKATVHRILTALARNGLLEQMPATRKYRLGPESLRLAQVREASVPITAILAPVLAQLSTDSGETAHASLGASEGMLTIGVSEPQRSTRVFVDPSASLPFHASASGQVFCAFADAEQGEAILQATRFEQFTETTPVDARDLRQRVDAARQNGFAVAHGTLEADTVGVAAPFFDASGRVIGAVAVAGLSSRMDGEAIARAGALVCAAAKQVTRQLGGRSGA
ncbi:IclR family transcriptional regulator [Gemmobacter caeni]|uniref:IclR family transcriptional regulator n=3 Tax=Paracoccaceae TaxID=31989 RepID=A0A2T6B1V4_9RHOB|nr:IclR family transcriptional regulator [Gemmobacter caeni]TWJ01949.1 IclR family transcriptional regulator [Gemmobacter caeni]